MRIGSHLEMKIAYGLIAEMEQQAGDKVQIYWSNVTPIGTIKAPSGSLCLCNGNSSTPLFIQAGINDDEFGWDYVLTESRVRQAINDGSSLYLGRFNKVASFPTSRSGLQLPLQQDDIVILTVDDGANQKGLYVRDGLSWVRDSSLDPTFINDQVAYLDLTGSITTTTTDNVTDPVWSMRANQIPNISVGPNQVTLSDRGQYELSFRPSASNGDHTLVIESNNGSGWSPLMTRFVNNDTANEKDRIRFPSWTTFGVGAAGLSLRCRWTSTAVGYPTRTFNVDIKIKRISS